MPTTRHLLNRRRRLATQQGGEEEPPVAEKGTPGSRTATAVHERRSAGRTPAKPGPEKAGRTGRTATAQEAGVGPEALAGRTSRTARTGAAAGAAPAPRPESPSRKARSGATASPESDTPGTDTPGGEDAPAGSALRTAPRRPLAVCAVVTLVFGAFAAWGASESGALRDGAAARNTALSDAGRTSEVKGEVAGAVNALFSYDHTRPAENTRAAERLLTGRAVKQHRALLAQVRGQGGKQRLVLTTTVTDSAVAALEGDRARVLLFADQHSARTGKSAQKNGKGTKNEKNDDATYAGAMLSVDAVREAGTWKIAGIDTLN